MLKATGDGVVASQNPGPGRFVAHNTVCNVRLAKQSGGKDRSMSTAAYKPKATVSNGPHGRLETR